VPSLELGRIIWAELPSSDRSSKKRRPAVVITPTAEIVAGEPFQVVSATTKFTEPLPADQIHLPWHRDGKVRTQLRQPTVVVCGWACEIVETDVLRYGGIVPPNVMFEIIQIINRERK
jgi:mRNA-degrading endonuclease toxin of MazEF toxin-antitoxin module